MQYEPMLSFSIATMIRNYMREDGSIPMHPDPGASTKPELTTWTTASYQSDHEAMDIPVFLRGHDGLRMQTFE